MPRDANSVTCIICLYYTYHTTVSRTPYHAHYCPPNKTIHLCFGIDIEVLQACMAHVFYDIRRHPAAHQCQSASCCPTLHSSGTGHHFIMLKKLPHRPRRSKSQVWLNVLSRCEANTKKCIARLVRGHVEQVDLAVSGCVFGSELFTGSIPDCFE